MIRVWRVLSVFVAVAVVAVAVYLIYMSVPSLPSMASIPAPSDPPSLASAAANPDPTDALSGSSVSLTDEERRGQAVEGSRYRECLGIAASVDEAPPTVELAAATASMVVVATIEEIGGGFYNTREHKPLSSEDRATMRDVYRPTAIRIEAAVKGISAEERLKVRLPGGQVGCDSYHVELVAGLAEPGRYLLFLQNLPDAKGEPLDELTILRAWPISANDTVMTAVDGDLPLSMIFERTTK